MCGPSLLAYAAPAPLASAVAPVGDPGAENRRDVVPHQPDLMLEDIELFASRYVLFERAAPHQVPTAAPRR